MGVKCPPYYGKSKFYAKKREKAYNKIAKYQEIVEICNAELEKQDEKKNK